MAFPIIESVSTQNSGASATSLQVVDYPTGIAVGDLVISIAWRNGSSSGINLPTGFTNLRNQTGVPRTRIAYREIDGTEGATFSWGGTSNQNAAVALRISGWDNTSAPEASTQSVSTTTTPDPLVVNPSWSGTDNLFLAVLSADQDNVSDEITAYPTNYPEAVEIANPGLGIIGVGSRSIASDSENPGTFTQNTSQQSSPWTIAIRGTVGGGGGSGIVPILLAHDHFGGGLAA